MAKRIPLTVSGGRPSRVSSEKRLYFAATGFPPQQAEVNITKPIAEKGSAILFESWDVGLTGVNLPVSFIALNYERKGAS